HGDLPLLREHLEARRYSVRLVMELDPTLLCRFTDGVGEVQVLRLHQEVEDVAVLAASEAVEVVVRVDREGGRALGVEGTEAHVLAAPSVQRDRRGHDLDEVRAVADLGNHRLGDLLPHDRLRRGAHIAAQSRIAIASSWSRSARSERSRVSTMRSA